MVTQVVTIECKRILVGRTNVVQFQMFAMNAVGSTGLYYEWTPNKVALGLVCVGAVWLAIKMLNGRATEGLLNNN
jgi:hypothetical protein